MNHLLILDQPFSITFPSLLRMRFWLRTFLILHFILIFGLLVFYIFQINEMTKISYLLSNYEKKVNKLTEENKNLEINFSRINSLENLESLAKNLNFEKVKKIHYIQVRETTVATK